MFSPTKEIENENEMGMFDVFCGYILFNTVSLILTRSNKNLRNIKIFDIKDVISDEIFNLHMKLSSNHIQLLQFKYL